MKYSALLIYLAIMCITPGPNNRYRKPCSVILALSLVYCAVTALI